MPAVDTRTGAPAGRTGKPILVTGAGGYIGGRCAESLAGRGLDVRRGTRRLPDGAGDEPWVAYGDLADSEHLDAAVAGCGTVVHFAGHAHVRESPAEVAAAERANITGTERLARACARAGVERLIFISSALVLSGSRDAAGRISDASPPMPLTAYARTKAQAEQKLREIGAETGLNWIVLRPPMVYGPGSPGNFHRLVRAVDAGLPLPLGQAVAPKSFIQVSNLISAVSALIDHPDVRRESFVVADAEVTSTAGLIRLMASALGRPARLLPVPQAACRMLGRAIGKSDDIERLFEPLEIDLSGFTRRLQWRPPVRLDDGVRETVAAWREGRSTAK